VYALELPDRLASSLAIADSGHAPLLGLATAGGDLCEDLSDVPRGARYLALRGKARGLAQLTHMHALEVVWASGVTPSLLEALASVPQLRALNLYQIGRTELAAVRSLRGLEHLLIGWANHLTDVSWLAELPRLTTLVIEDTPRLDLGTLPPHLGFRHCSLGGVSGRCSSSGASRRSLGCPGCDLCT
jgi:hypothetical protein